MINVYVSCVHAKADDSFDYLRKNQVMDLAAGHVAALTYINRPSKNFLKSNGTVGKPHGKGGGGHRAFSVFNLGTGNGYTVLDIINAMKVSIPLSGFTGRL